MNETLGCALSGLCLNTHSVQKSMINLVLLELLMCPRKILKDSTRISHRKTISLKFRNTILSASVMLHGNLQFDDKTEL